MEAPPEVPRKPEPNSCLSPNLGFTLPPCGLPTCTFRATKSRFKTKMTLTEEQKERIRKNRQRALEIRKRRQKEESEARDAKRLKGEQEIKDKGGEKQEEVALEDFEVGASSHVSKREAMQMYCLPEGTLAVCSFIEKENPRHKAWTPMKLYERAEIRRRARERFGGMEGLVAERRKRQEKRFRNDLERTKDIFKK